MVERPFESIFADELTKDMDTYHINNNHRSHRYGDNNHYPSIRFDIREQLWDKIPEGENDLEYRLLDDFHDYIADQEIDDFEVTTCMNGYHMILLAPLPQLEDEREEKEEELEEEMNCSAPDPDTIEELKDEIKDIDEQIIRCSIAYGKFKEFVEGLKGYFDEHVTVINEEGDFDCVHKSIFEDFREEEGWRIYDEELENEIETIAEEESAEEFVEIALSNNQSALKGVKQEGVDRMKNSMCE